MNTEFIIIFHTSKKEFSSPTELAKWLWNGMFEYKNRYNFFNMMPSKDLHDVKVVFTNSGVIVGEAVCISFNKVDRFAEFDYESICIYKEPLHQISELQRIKNIGQTFTYFDKESEYGQLRRFLNTFEKYSTANLEDSENDIPWFVKE
jgi:hypothetical protein